MSEGIDPSLTSENIANNDNEHKMDLGETELNKNSDGANNVSVLQSELEKRQHILSDWQLKSKRVYQFSDKTKVSPFSIESINNKMVNENTNNSIKGQVEQKITSTISGADVYSTVLHKKRKRSPTMVKKTAARDTEQTEDHINATTTKNRFSIFNLDNNTKIK